MKLKGMSATTLAKLFALGGCPTASSFLDNHSGFAEWWVDMLTGPIPNLGVIFRHRKQFYRRDNGSISGCNVFFKDARWGWFEVDDTHVVDDVDRRGVLLIDYNQVENGALTRRRIVDKVRTTASPDVMLGEFYYHVAGAVFGPYYFSLTRLVLKD